MSDFAATLFCETPQGGGEPIVLVHGLGGNTNTWFPQLAVLRRDFEVFAYDFAGSGRSPAVGEMSIARHVADLTEIVARSARGRAHLAGHSMGTVVCQHFAAANPGRVASLALLGGFPEPPAAARAALRDRAAKARAGGMVAIADAIVAAGTADDTKVNQPAAAAFLRESLMAQPAEGYARNCEALAAATAADLSRIACPVLLLTGDQDRIAPPEVVRAMASVLANAQVQILPGCGHWPTIERAKQVNYALTLFHARLRRDAEQGGEPVR